MHSNIKLGVLMIQNIELKGIYKACLKVLSWHLLGKTKENHKIFIWDKPLLQPRFKHRQNMQSYSSKVMQVIANFMLSTFLVFFFFLTGVFEMHFQTIKYQSHASMGQGIPWATNSFSTSSEIPCMESRNPRCDHERPLMCLVLWWLNIVSLAVSSMAGVRFPAG